MAAISSQPRTRPHSRASTASARSVSTQPTLEPAFNQPTACQAPWLNDPSRPQNAPVPPQMSPEDMILQAASQLTAGGMPHPQVNHNTDMQFQQHSALVSVPGFPQNHPFTHHDGPVMDHNEQENDSTSVPKSQTKTSRTSANNELEMRELFRTNKHRTLQDVAAELHGNERGPNSERTRQVFAMLWINQGCAKGKGSVPRGRVYANYANRCANERITVLNPASFGKLVRVLFPGLKTRRLGVRGESKYHYVNFMLLEDQVELKEATSQPAALLLPDNRSFSQSFNSVPATASKSPFPTPDLQPTENFNTRPRRTSTDRSHSIYNLPNLDSLDQLEATSTKTSQPLSFSWESTDAAPQTEAVVLPRLEPFAPPGADPDAVKSLTALYRSHCTSLIECIRYCKEKTFFHLFTSFHGTLTMPVQKLFCNPAMAPWIEECDFILYQRMMRIISSLTLQVMPTRVLDTFRNICEKLVPHIRESFHGQPPHVIRAKETPAAIFSSLLDRALRVNLTAHAAANMLANPANRDQMYHDWITLVKVRKVAECVPTRGMDDCVNLLLTEIKHLIDPQSVQWEIEAITPYAEASLRTGKVVNKAQQGGGAQSVLDLWVSFLRSLPPRFPYASHADIVWCVQRVGTAVMRDLTINQGKSFGSWWVTKCWIDEMVAFMAEKGGFMEQKSSNSTPAPVARQEPVSVASALAMPEANSDIENLPVASQAQPDRALFPAPPGEATTNDTTNTDVLALQDAHDDSGIGIRTPEDEFSKFEFQTSGASLNLDTSMSGVEG